MRNEATYSPCHSCIKDHFDNGILDPSCGHIAGSSPSQIVEAQNSAAKATRCHKAIHWLTPPSSICEDDRCTPIHLLHRQRFRCASFDLRLKPGTERRNWVTAHLHSCVNRNAYTCYVHCSPSTIHICCGKPKQRTCNAVLYLWEAHRWMEWIGSVGL